MTAQISVQEMYDFIRARRIQMEHMDEVSRELNRRATIPPRSHDVERFAAIEKLLAIVANDPDTFRTLFAAHLNSPGTLRDFAARLKGRAA